MRQSQNKISNKNAKVQKVSMDKCAKCDLQEREIDVEKK